MQQHFFERILGILCSVLDAHSAVLFLPEEGTVRFDTMQEIESYRLASVFSLGDKVALNARVAPGKGLVGWMIRNREPLLVPNFDQHKHHLGYYLDNEEVRIKAFMGCALPGGLGAICVDSKRQYSFSEKDQKLLHLFADLIAEAVNESTGTELQRQELSHYAALKIVYTLRREYPRWAEFLRKFLDVISTTSGFSYAVFCSLHPNGETFGIEGENMPVLAREKSAPSQFSIQGGIVGWVFRNDAPLFSDGAGGLPESSLFGKGVSIPPFQSILAFPLILQKKTRGVLCLASQAPITASVETRDFVRMASEHLALFLENLYVKCRLRDMYHDMTQQQANKE